MMHRRDFIKHIALLSAGLAASKEQVQNFISYYEINTPVTSEPLISIDDVFISGLASCSSPTWINIFSNDENVLPLGFNAFGGCVRWMAGPDQKIVRPLHGARWQIKNAYTDPDWCKNYLNGYISYIQQDGKRIKRLIDKFEDSL